MEPGRPSGRRSIRARPPERVFGDFLRAQKVTRRRPRQASIDRKDFVLALPHGYLRLEGG